MPHKRYLRVLPCQECGADFIGIDFGGGIVTKTCSQKCLGQARDRQLATLCGRKGSSSPSWTGGRSIWCCAFCAREFTAYRKEGGAGRKFCSWVCANRANNRTALKMQARLRFENKLMEFLTNRGYTCIRSAGSRGIADVIAINAIHVRAIQLKTTKRSTADNLGVYKAAVLSLRQLPSPPNLTRELWVKPLRRNWIYIVVDDLPEEPELLRKALNGTQWVEA